MKNPNLPLSGNGYASVRFGLIAYNSVLVLLWAISIAFLYKEQCHLFDRYGNPGPNQWMVLHCLAHPYTFDPGINFNDLTDYYGKLQHIVPTQELSSGLPVYNYPAPAAFVYSWILRSPSPIVTFTLLVLISLLVAAGLMSRALYKTGAGITPQIALWSSVICLGPFGYIFWRSNLEGIAWIFFCASIACLYAEYFSASAVFLGLGICIKPFPALLFFLLLKRRKFKEVALGCCVAAVTQIMALHALGPSVLQAYKLLSRGVVFYKDIYILNFRLTEARFQHSVLDTLKAFQWHLHAFNISQGDAHLHWAYNVYLLLLPVILFGTVWAFRKQPSLNQLFAIVILILVLAPVAAEYTLVLLYLPWSGLILHLAKDVTSGNASYSRLQICSLLIPCALIFAPLNYLSLYGGSFKCIFLFALLIAVRLVPMRSSIFGEIAKPVTA